MRPLISTRLSGFLCLLLLTACQSDEPFLPVYQVPAEIQEHVDTFLEEATARGYELELDNLIIKIDPEMEVGKCGVCNSLASPKEQQKVIRLNPTCLNLNATLIETLVIHELGHCILLRPHDDTLLPNGEPKSLMIANNIYLYSPCVYAIDGSNCDLTYKRPYYLDELFDPSTEVPAWAE